MKHLLPPCMIPEPAASRWCRSCAPLPSRLFSTSSTKRTFQCAFVFMHAYLHTRATVQPSLSKGAKPMISLGWPSQLKRGRGPCSTTTQVLHQNSRCDSPRSQCGSAGLIGSLGASMTQDARVSSGLEPCWGNGYDTYQNCSVRATRTAHCGASLRVSHRTVCGSAATHTVP